MEGGPEGKGWAEEAGSVGRFGFEARIEFWLKGGTQHGGRRGSRRKGRKGSLRRVRETKCWEEAQEEE